MGNVRKLDSIRIATLSQHYTAELYVHSQRSQVPNKIALNLANSFLKDMLWDNQEGGTLGQNLLHTFLI